MDIGIVRFATLSNGEYFEPINAFKNLKGKLAKLQKRFKNKTKFSKNWQKLKAKIAKKLAEKFWSCAIAFKISTSKPAILPSFSLKSNGGKLASVPPM
ncbi:transposase [Kingella negevensis]|uniref:transposase n=1 Tax=Kingella negevensis TaxID=1522312 RepID=UPI0031580330